MFSQEATLEQKDLFSRLVAHIDSSGEDEGLSGVNIKIKVNIFVIFH